MSGEWSGIGPFRVTAMTEGQPVAWGANLRVPNLVPFEEKDTFAPLERATTVKPRVTSRTFAGGEGASTLTILYFVLQVGQLNGFDAGSLMRPIWPLLSQLTRSR